MPPILSSFYLSRLRLRPTLKRIGFYNTKAFQGWQEIPVKTFNLIYGQNSAGKSSLLHSILWIHEVLKNKKINIKKSSLAKDFVDFGGIHQFLNKNNPKNKKIGFSLTFLEPTRFTFYQSLGSLIYDFITPKNLRAEKYKNDEKQIKTRKIITSCLDKIFDEKVDARPKNKTRPLDVESKSLEITLEVIFDLNRALAKPETMQKELASILPDIAMYFNNSKIFRLESQKEKNIKELNDDEEREIKSYIDGMPAEIYVSAKLNHLLLAQTIEQIFQILKKERPEKELDNLFHENECKKAPSDIAQNNQNPNKPENKISSSLNLNDFRGRNVGLEVFPSLNVREQALAQTEFFESGKLGKNLAALFMLEAVGNTLQKACKNLFENPKYLAAYRVYPRRFVSEYDLLDSEKDDPYGVNALNILVETDTRKRLNECCKKLGADFEFFPGDSQRDIGSVLRIGSKIANPDHNLSYRDIGFGWSQVVPVLFELIKEEFSIFMCEQPELHLHPSAQSMLMEVIVQTFLENRNRNGEENSKPFAGKTVFLELHSEQMILRLLKTIKNKTFEKMSPGWFPEDLFSLLYVERKDGKTSVKEIGIEKSGTLSKEWPGGIMGSAISDLQYEQ